MKKIFIILPFLAFLLILVGCKREVYTVEKFLNENGRNEGTLESNYIAYDNVDEHIQDTDNEIRNILLDNVEYKKSNKFKKTESFFKWYKYLSSSTSGPNEITLYFYADGHVLIDRNYALGPNGRFYYTLDQDKAEEIYSFVSSKVEDSIHAREEAFSIARESNSNLNDFINELNSNRRAAYYYLGEDFSNKKYFSDDSALIAAIYNASYTYQGIDSIFYSSHEPYGDLIIFVDYTFEHLTVTSWFMSISRSGNVTIFLNFMDALARSYSFSYEYAVDSETVDVFLQYA